MEEGCHLGGGGFQPKILKSVRRWGGIISKCWNGTLVTLLALIVVRERRKDWRNRLLRNPKGQADHEQAIRSFSGAGRAC
jgi:hypothetical protein